MIKQPKRNRPRISTTIGARTQAIIHMVAKEQALSTPGTALDYIVNDWTHFKQAAIRAAAPLDHLDMAVAGSYDEPLTVNP
jgi:hypothetical protein